MSDKRREAGYVQCRFLLAGKRYCAEAGWSATETHKNRKAKKKVGNTSQGEPTKTGKNKKLLVIKAGRCPQKQKKSKKGGLQRHEVT